MSTFHGGTVFLSGTAETQNRTNLFRPKEIREVVFPGVGMIMHSLFWVKHTFHLAENGYDPADQDHILLWASGDEPNAAESLLYYCIYSNMQPNTDVSVNAGIRTTRNWLFSPDSSLDGDIYGQVGEALIRLSSDPTQPDFEAFVDDIFAPWFSTRCEELGINLENELMQELGSALDIDDIEERHRSLAAAFCTVLARLIHGNKTLRGGKNMRVNSTTIDFATDLLEVATGAQREQLANTDLSFTAEEAGALLGAVGRLPNGEHFLRSLLFILHLDPTTHSGGEISQQMRRVYDFVSAEPDALFETARRYGLADRFENILEDMEKTAFFWLLNFFMATGETIARDLLEDLESPLTEADVLDYFEEHESRSERFRSFFDYSEAAGKYLPELAEVVTDDVKTANFVDTLIQGIESELSLASIFIKLLESQGTISEISEGHYFVESRPQNTNPASFYGIGPLTSWAATLATSVDAA